MLLYWTIEKIIKPLFRPLYTINRRKCIMEIKDLKANTGNVDIVASVVEKETARSFEKFGKQGRVCKAKLRDETGEVKLTLWNEDVDKVNVGDKIHLQNGWCSEYQGETQLSSGKFGKIEVVGKSAAVEKGTKSKAAPQMFTNDPGLLNPQAPEGSEEQDEDEVSMEDMEEDVD